MTRNYSPPLFMQNVGTNKIYNLLLYLEKKSLLSWNRIGVRIKKAVNIMYKRTKVVSV